MAESLHKLADLANSINQCGDIVTTDLVGHAIITGVGERQEVVEGGVEALPDYLPNDDPWVMDEHG